MLLLFRATLCLYRDKVSPKSDLLFTSSIENIKNSVAYLYTFRSDFFQYVELVCLHGHFILVRETWNVSQKHMRKLNRKSKKLQGQLSPIIKAIYTLYTDTHASTPPPPPPPPTHTHTYTHQTTPIGHTVCPFYAFTRTQWDLTWQFHWTILHIYISPLWPLYCVFKCTQRFVLLHIYIALWNPKLPFALIYPDNLIKIPAPAE